MNVLIIMACSSSKLNNPAKAKDIYTGQLFKAIKKLVNKNKFDYVILSGKYGIIKPNKLIRPYNQQIKLKKDIIRIQKQAIPVLKRLIPKYDRIITIMGKKYIQVIEPVISRKFYIVFDSRGIGGYKQLVKKMISLNKTQLWQFLKRYKN